MHATLWFAGQPLWLASFLIVIFPTALVMLVAYGVRRRVSLAYLAQNNEVAGFKIAVLGVIYAVLLGFAVIVVWEKFHDSQAAVVQEAGASVAIGRLAIGLPPPDRAAVRRATAAYLRTAIEQDWPAMSRGELNTGGVRALDDLYGVVLAAPAPDSAGATLRGALLAQLDELTQARRVRTVLAEGLVPGMIWAVLVVGAAATILFTFFFGATNQGAQVVMTGLLTACICMALMAVVMINYPFSGPVSVGTRPLQQALEYFGTQ